MTTACDRYSLSGTVITHSVFGSDPGHDVDAIQISVQGIDDFGNPTDFSRTLESRADGTWGPILVPQDLDLRVTTSKESHLTFEQTVPALESTVESRELELLTSEEKAIPIDPSSAVVLFKLGREQTFVYTDTLRIDDGPNLIDVNTTGASHLSVYPDDTPGPGHASFTVGSGLHTYSFSGRDNGVTLQGTFLASITGPETIHYIDMETHSIISSADIKGYFLSGKVTDKSFFGGQISSDIDSDGHECVHGLNVDIYAVDEDTLTRYNINATTLEATIPDDESDAVPFQSLVTDADGRWGPVVVPERTTLEIITHGYCDGLPFHHVHNYINLYSRWGGADHLDLSTAASSEMLSTIPSPSEYRPAYDSPIIVLRKEPFSIEYDSDTDVKDKLFMNLDPTAPDILGTDVINASSTPPTGSTSESHRIAIYHAIGGADSPGHFDQVLNAKTYSYYFSKGNSKDTVYHNKIRAFQNPDAAIIPQRHISYAKFNGRFCPQAYWYYPQEDTSGSGEVIERCIKGARYLNEAAWTEMEKRIPDFTPTAARWLTSTMARHTLLDGSNSDGVIPVRHRPGLFFDDHHSLINTRFNIQYLACDVETASPTECPCGQNTPRVLPTVGDFDTTRIGQDILAMADMYLWYILRKPAKSEEAVPASHPYEYQMGFRTTGGDLLIYEHVVLPIIYYEGSTAYGVGERGINALVDEGILEAPTIELCNVDGTDAQPYNCFTSDRTQPIAFYFPVDMERHFFRSEQPIAKIRPKLIGTECILSTDVGAMTAEHQQLSIWDLLAYDTDPRAPRNKLEEVLEYLPAGDPFEFLHDNSLTNFAQGFGSTCQYSSNPRFRDPPSDPLPSSPPDPRADPRYYDNRTWVEVLPKYGDAITTSDLFSTEMHPLTEINTFNCLDTRPYTYTGGEGGSFATAYGINFVATSNHPIHTYFAEESDYHEAEGVTVYTNMYHQEAEIMMEFIDSEVTGGPDDCPGGDADPSTALICEYGYRSETYPRYILIREMEGPRWIQICGSDVESSTVAACGGGSIWENCGECGVPAPIFTDEQAASFVAYFSWDQDIGPARTSP